MKMPITVVTKLRFLYTYFVRIVRCVFITERIIQAGHFGLSLASYRHWSCTTKTGRL